MSEGHSSDCAVHNEPAYPNGPCDCNVDHDPGAFPEDYARKLREVRGEFRELWEVRCDTLETRVDSCVHQLWIHWGLLILTGGVVFVLMLWALGLQKAHASDAQFNVYAQPALTQTSVDFREVVSWQKRGLTCDIGVRAYWEKTCCVSVLATVPNHASTTVMAPGQTIVGATTFEKKQTGSQSQITELEIQSRLTALRIEAVPFLLRGPVQPLIVGQWYRLTVQATGKDDKGQTQTAEERFTAFLPAIGAQLRYPLAYTICDVKAAVGPRLAFVEAGVSGAVTENLKARLGIRANRARLENVKIDTNAVFASVEWAF